MEYYIHDGKTQSGPFTKEEIKTSYNKPGYFIWKEGMEEWDPVASLFPQPKTQSIPFDMTIPVRRTATKPVKAEKNKGIQKLILPIIISFLVIGLSVTLFVLHNRFEVEKEKYLVLKNNFLRNSFMIRELAFENNIPKIYIQRSENIYKKAVNRLYVKYFDKQGNLVKYQDKDLDFTYISQIQFDNTTPELMDDYFFAPESKSTQFVLMPVPRLGDIDQKYIPFPTLTKGEYRVEIWLDKHLLASAYHTVQ